jgi:hypothetical protein
MRGKTLYALLAATAALGGFCTAASGNSDFADQRLRGGFVVPCSLAGVNPAYHPDIFGNPAVARRYGFVLGPDRAWHVVPGCRGF